MTKNSFKLLNIYFPLTFRQLYIYIYIQYRNHMQGNYNAQTFNGP
jgi:hypothetical protein